MRLSATSYDGSDRTSMWLCAAGWLPAVYIYMSVCVLAFMRVFVYSLFFLGIVYFSCLIG